MLTGRWNHGLLVTDEMKKVWFTDGLIKHTQILVSNDLKHGTSVFGLHSKFYENKTWYLLRAIYDLTGKLEFTGELQSFDMNLCELEKIGPCHPYENSSCDWCQWSSTMKWKTQQGSLHADWCSLFLSFLHLKSYDPNKDKIIARMHYQQRRQKCSKVKCSSNH